MRKIMRIFMLTASLAFTPATAWAVNVSSDDGSGTQHVETWYKNGADMSGWLKSTHGDPVYYAGEVVYNYYPDEECGRYSPNTTSKDLVKRGGICATQPTIPTADGMRAKVCEDRNNWPDDCGAWSDTIWK